MPSLHHSLLTFYMFCWEVEHPAVPRWGWAERGLELETGVQTDASHADLPANGGLRLKILLFLFLLVAGFIRCLRPWNSCI